MGFLSVEYAKGSSCVEVFEQVEFGKMESTVSRSSGLVAVEDSIAPPMWSVVSCEKIRTVHNGKRIILDGHYWCQDEGSEVSTSRDSCWKLSPVMVSYCCDIFDWEAISIVRHETMVSRLCFRYLLSPEDCERMNGVTNQDLEKELRAGKRTILLWD